MLYVCFLFLLPLVENVKCCNGLITKLCKPHFSCHEFQGVWKT